MNRAKHMKMYMDTKTSKPDKERALNLLTTLQGALREANPYVQDFVHVGEIFAQEEVTNAHFVIEAKERPNDPNDARYKNHTAFNEVRVHVLRYTV